MIGIGYKKLAEELSLTQADGIAYGTIQGYVTTLSEGAGYKDIFISAGINEETGQIIKKYLEDEENKNKYRITSFEMTDKSIYIVFFDNPGTMDRIRQFIEWFYPILNDAAALGANNCYECKQVLTDPVTKFINNKAVLLHGYCAEKIAEDFKEQNKLTKEKSSLGKGFLGALIGGILGAIPWAIVYYFGWFVGWLGFLIGYLAQKGYSKFGGKSRKATIAVIGLAIIISVFFAQFLGECIGVGYYILNGEIPGYTLAEAPGLVFYVLSIDSEVAGSFFANIGIGMIFAALGTFSILKNISKEAGANTPNIKDAPQDI